MLLNDPYHKFDEAGRNGWRVFWQEGTQTLRQIPQNYCLAIQRDGRWLPAPDKASTINAHSLGIVLEQNAHLQGKELAHAVHEAFWGPNIKAKGITMSAKHTPGPWALDRRAHCWAIVDAKGQDLAYQDDQPHVHDSEPCGSLTSRGRTVEELAANARLIAAAPALLRGCQAAMAYLVDPASPHRSNRDDAAAIIRDALRMVAGMTPLAADL